MQSLMRIADIMSKLALEIVLSLRNHDKGERFGVSCQSLFSFHALKPWVSP